MPSLVIRRARHGWAALPGAVDLQAPRYVSGTAAASSVALTFDENLRAAPAFAQFTATVNGTARGVTAAVVAAKVVTLTRSSAVTAGQAVIVTYTPGGTPATRLADASARAVEAEAFVTPTITAT